LLANNPDIEMDEEVYLSEKRTGNKNRALAYLLKTYGMIEDDVEDVLDCYFRACSIKVNCADLAKIGLTLASHGKSQFTGERIFPAKYAYYVNAILMNCGMYDGSGEFAVKVGVPAKSGVGGGIMAIVPTRMGIGIYSPALDSKGNSIAGIKALEMLSKKLYLSIF
jgi:glutaminase